MPRLIETIKQKKRAAPKSFALLVSLAGGAAGLWLFSLLFFSQHLIRLPACTVHRITGLYCLTCGATRASALLARLQLFESLKYNPAPLLIALMLLSAIIFYLVNVVRGKDRPYPLYFVWLYTILGVLIVFCVLRNVGILPMLLTN